MRSPNITSIEIDLIDQVGMFVYQMDKACYGPNMEYFPCRGIGSSHF